MKRFRSRRKWLLVIALCVIAGIDARAERPEDIPNPKTRDNTWVTDAPGRLRPETVQQLNRLLDQLERETTAEVAVVVIRTLDGRSIEDFAVDLFRRWGIGKRKRNNGILFLWAADDRRVRIEVGYGLEGILPDGKAGAILNHQVFPRFRTGAYDAGVLNGVQAIAAVIRKEPVDLPSVTTGVYEPTSASTARRADEPDDGLPLELLGLLGVLPLGIGSVVGYRKWRRYHKRTCPECGTKMLRLSETDEDEWLDKVKQLEERLGSVDYDVWTCPQCSHHFTLRYPKWFGHYSKCPQCDNRTLSETEQTITPATTVEEGEARVTEDCEFCTYRRSYTKTIPRITTSSSSSGGGWGGGGGSSGSFGGGSSGGGGASGSY